MTVTIDSPVTAEQVRERAEASRTEFEAAIGGDYVLDSADAIAEFSDPYDNQTTPKFRASYVLQPKTTEEIQEIVKIASEYRVPIWTSSQGRNNGYGGAAGRIDGSVVVNLRRMNQILEVNEKYGYVELEPGVSFAELNAYLVENDYALWSDVPDLSWGSVVGNTLEHGVGYTPYGEHADFVCGMEVVLADGDLVRTGMGAQANSQNFHTHQRGFGPRLDEMFMQSNFGIVTKMGLWLMPRPTAWRAVFVHCDSDESCYDMIDALRPLLMDGTIRNRVTVMSLMAMLPAMSVKADWQPDHAPVDDEVRSLMRERTGLGNWNARIGLYGEPGLMDIQQRLIEDAVAHIPDARVAAREYSGDAKAEDVLGIDQAMAGIPNMDLLNYLNWYGWEHTGHVAYAPITPLSGDDARALHDMVSDHCGKHGRDFGEAFCLTPRSMQLFALILYNAGDKDDQQKIYDMTADLIVDASARGYGEYRGHLDFMDLVADQSDFNNHAGRRLNERLKAALDPVGVLNPGRQGIWGGDFTQPLPNHS